MISIYTIEKNSKDEFEIILKNYEKMINRFSKIKNHSIFSNKISQAQNQSSKIAQNSYTQAFLPYLKNSFNIALHPNSKEVDSFLFAKIISSHSNINFFIGGAFGFEKEFLKKCNDTISLSKLTMSHKIAKIVLYEQIYRAFTIINNHPYHK